MMGDLLDMAHSELRSLVTKAARGAGLSWGLAEDAGWAAEWLARRSMPAGKWAADWLAEAIDGLPDPVRFGASMADRLASGEGPLSNEDLPDDMVAPAYLLPYLHLVATKRGPVEISDPHGRVALVDANGPVIFGPSWAERTRSWSINSASAIQDASRAFLEHSVAECLEQLALRTTVPSSDTSRCGAGSARSDND
jgi:hypothetical protein